MPVFDPTDQAIPSLPSRSMRDTAAFYRQLGFDAELVGAAYAIVRHGPVELHFFAHDALRPAESSAGCYLRVADVARVYEAFLAADLPRTGIPRQDALSDTPWGMREFALVDPDGNQIRIGQVL